MDPDHSRPIVCGTDFSEPATQAASIAAAIAKRVNAPLLLVHGVDERGEIPSHYWPSYVESARPHLNAEAARLRLLGANVEEQFANGIPEDGVARRAERADARLIVVASSGHGAVGRWLLGSVTERIAESAWVPTLVLRAADRLEDWACGGRPLRVFVAADFTPSSDAALAWAAGLCEIGPCEFVVGYVDRFVEERAEQARHAPPDTPRAPEMQEMLIHDLREKARNIFPKHDVTIRVLPAPGRVDSHLLELVAEAHAGLIVLGTHQWQGLSRLRHPSVSRRVLHAAPVSVACVPPHRVIAGTSVRLPKMRYVIAATDLSTHGSHAVPYAYEALDPGGTVCLLHIARPGEMHEPLLARLRELIPEEAVRRGLRTDVRVATHDHTATGLCEAAERFHADLLCLGSQRRSDLTAGALGSIAHAVISRCACPVLIVPVGTI